MRLGAATLLAIGLTLSAASAQSTNTNGSTSYSPTTPNFVSIPHIPTMYINGGGAGAAGAQAVKFIHDWGKYGIEAALDCDRKNANLAISTLMGYEASLSGAYDQASAAGQDGSALLNDASVIASVVNYIRQALSACKPPQGAMLVPSMPPGEAYASVPHRDSGGLLSGVSIGIGIGVGGGEHRDHRDDRHGSSDDQPKPPRD